MSRRVVQNASYIAHSLLFLGPGASQCRATKRCGPIPLSQEGKWHALAMTATRESMGMFELAIIDKLEVFSRTVDGDVVLVVI